MTRSKLLIIIALLFIEVVSHAQPMDYKLTSQILQEGNAKVAHFGKDYNQMLAQDFAKIGDYKNALSYWDKMSSGNRESITGKDSLFFNSYLKQDAKEFILGKAQKEQVVMINEAHHMPLHRIFTLSLLQDLYTIGFRYLGIETLDESDSLLNSRKYPLIRSGWYTREAAFNRMVKAALEMGYTLFPYDASASMNERDLTQAKNIAKVLTKDSIARILIYAGFDHIKEKPNPDWITMAVNFKQITGINPFTIDQVEMSERSSEIFENPYYKIANVDRASVFVDKNNQSFVEPINKSSVDLQVFHPRTSYVNNRPSWLLSNKKFIQYLLKEGELPIECPCLVKAYGTHRASIDDIPVDIVEVASKEDKVSLILQKRSYLIKVTNGKDEKSQFSLNLK